MMCWRLDALILVFLMLSFKPAFSLSSFTFIKRSFHWSPYSLGNDCHQWLKFGASLCQPPSPFFPHSTLPLCPKTSDNFFFFDNSSFKWISVPNILWMSTTSHTVSSSGTCINGQGSRQQSRDRRERHSAWRVGHTLLLPLTHCLPSQRTVRWQYPKGNTNTTDPRRNSRGTYLMVHGKDSALPVQGTGAWSSNPGRGARSHCHKSQVHPN